jgi:hypothetical protein
MMKHQPLRPASSFATSIYPLVRLILPALAPTGVLLLQACSDLPQWLKPKPPVADATGKVVGDCRDYWPLNAQVSSCAMDARDACADPVIYMRTVSSSGPRSDTNVDGLTDFRVTYQCRRNVEGHG